MIINHNMGSINAHRQMGINSTNATKSMEKLSSGLRINRAGDDAAGLSISEKMRGQIRGLDQASSNSQDAISLIQTAEGALNETTSILQRMRELAVQSSTDTNTDTDRKAIQDEMDQLTAEIDRISTTTEFNTQSLLNGGFKGTFQIGANSSQSIDLSINKMDTASLGLTSTNSLESIDLETGSNLKDGTYKVEGTNIVDADGNTVGTTDGTKITVNAKDTTLVTSKLNDNAIISVKDGKAEIKNTMSDYAKELAPGEYEVKGTSIVKDGKIVGDLGTNEMTIDGINDSTGAKAKITETMLGFKAGELKDGAKFTINGSDVSTRATAEGSIKSINDAIQTVSSERSKLGAYQNRLEHTIANLGTSSENLTSAESRIRDVDMAKEMSTFSKNNILAQAAQSMLAQANQRPQQVLSLLQ